MAESTHRCELVHVELLPHPNADSLSIVKVDGYQVVARTEDWKDVKQGVYIPPDSVVPLDNPRFAFLKDPKKPSQTSVRVKARKLRGEWSMGLLVPGPVDGVEWHDWGFPSVGDDVASWLGVTHYNPPEPVSTGGETEAPPKRVKVGHRDQAAARALGFSMWPSEPQDRLEQLHGASVTEILPINPIIEMIGSAMILRGCEPTRVRSWCDRMTRAIKEREPTPSWWMAL